MKFHLITLFQEACEPYVNASILGRAQKNKFIEIVYQNPRTFVDNKWGKVDERPYGGGPGMVMTALPVVKAVEKSIGHKGHSTKKMSDRKKNVIIWFSPSAKQFTNKDADALLNYQNVVFVCGRYEGIDERAKKILKTIAPVKEFAVGESVLTGGELPALVMIDAITRRIPGVLGKDASVEERRVASSAVYTRPESILHLKKRYRVPKVLQNGNHADIDAWREKNKKK